ncbi:hypothetical protein FRB97_008210 [Tulasnella sp. 331]|nr:hypothetical protein FRB97_008210 [Tulasnella sp. 331]
MRATVTMILLSAAATLAAPFHRAQSSLSFSGLTVFGDSLSDNGQAPGSAWVFTNHSQPPDPNYFNATARRWTNSFVWTERLASSLSVPLTDYAVGGATSNNSFIPGDLGPFIVPDTLQQYAQFAKILEGNPKDISKELFIILIGANDGLNAAVNNANPNRTVTYIDADVGARTVAVITLIVTNLISSGAKNILLSTIPDVSKSPLGSMLGPFIQAWQASMNADLHQLVDELRTSTAIPSDIKVSLSDLFIALQPVIANPSAYGFTAGSVTPCVVGTFNTTGYSLCSTDPAIQNTHVFWDFVHPTSPGHEIFKDTAYAALSNTYATEHAATYGELGDQGVLKTAIILKRGASAIFPAVVVALAKLAAACFSQLDGKLGKTFHLCAS